MTRDDITRMARKAGFVGFDGENKCLRQFAAIVAAAEREACAEILDANADRCIPSSTFMQLLKSNAAAIRARGQDPMPLFDDWPGGWKK